MTVAIARRYGRLNLGRTITMMSVALDACTFVNGFHIMNGLAYGFHYCTNEVFRKLEVDVNVQCPNMKTCLLAVVDIIIQT